MVPTADAEAARALEKEIILFGRHTMVVEEGYDPVTAAVLLHDAGLITLLPKSLLSPPTAGGPCQDAPPPGSFWTRSSRVPSSFS